jgi:hypothetical protein
MPIGLGKMYTQSQIDTVNRGTIEERQRKDRNSLSNLLSYYNTRKKKKAKTKKASVTLILLLYYDEY